MNDQLYKEIRHFLSFFKLNEKSFEIVKVKELNTHILSFKLREKLYKQENNQEFLEGFRLVLKNLTLKYGGDQNYLIDINGETLKEVEYVRDITTIAAKRVRSLKKEYEFGRLNGFKRMLVHKMAEDIQGVSTESRGVGSERRLYMILN